MGARLVLERPLDHDKFPIQQGGPYTKGDNRDNKQIQDRIAVPQFGMLQVSAEDRKRRRRVMAFCPLFEALAAGIMIWALMSLPSAPTLQMGKQQVLYFQPVAPPAVAPPAPRLLKTPPVPKVAAPVLPRLQQEHIQRPAAMARMKMPAISQPDITLPKAPPAPKPKPAETFTAAEVQRLAPKRQIAMLHTGAFNPGSIAKPTVKKPLRQVQTGGFGTENGIPNNPSADSHMQVAELGSFNMPVGPGHGNGTGGARGARGAVASSGFGNAVGAGAGARPRMALQRVQQSDFGNVIAGTQASRTHTAAQAAAFKPVVILSKPDPVYPPQARRQHIQGQVILSVLFGASGNLRVLKVERGLGHGMDAAAVQAAEQIKFKPAERNGRPVDSRAMVHIIFQLAF